MPLDEYRAANRDNWDDRVPIHVASREYDVESFVREPTSISAMVRFDQELVGDVTGKTLLHLQCHFGRDTLSWARLGARVTGLDFSPRAIEAARDLAKRAGIEARFIESELYDAPNALDERFDIVYTSMGVLCWLPSVRRWAQVVSHFLKPGGVFAITEIHPAAWTLDDTRLDGVPSPKFTYFETETPMRSEGDRTYTDGDATLQHTVTYEWNHSIGEIVTALIDAGLRIDLLREYPYILGHMPVPGMELDEDGMYRFPNGNISLPLMYSIHATKPA